MRILLIFLVFSLWLNEFQVETRKYKSYAEHLARLLRDLKLIRTRKGSSVFEEILRINEDSDQELFQGDIAKVNFRNRNAMRDRSKLWSSKIVPYSFQDGFSEEGKTAFTAAIEEFHKETCVRFVPRANQDDFIHVKKMTGCWSVLGRYGGPQELSLGTNCYHKGTIIHELMHALGFWHEQSRPDRDSHVKIMWGNIMEGKDGNFEKLDLQKVDTQNMPYDFSSIMHYGKYAFSKDGSPTIVPIGDADSDLGQREGLSKIDVMEINKLYNCTVKTGPIRAATTTVSETESTTLLPTTIRVTTMPSETPSSTRVTTPTPSTTSEHTVTLPPSKPQRNLRCGPSFPEGKTITFSSLDDDLDCDYHIKADKSSVVELVIEKTLTGFPQTQNCSLENITVYDGKDDSASLLAKVCESSQSVTVKSTSREVYIHVRRSGKESPRGRVSIRWSSPFVVKDCAYPILPDNSVMLGTTCDVGDTFAFSCHPGYKMIGSPVITCHNRPGPHGAWSDFYPFCFPG